MCRVVLNTIISNLIINLNNAIMADKESFDLLDQLADEKKINQLKAKIEKRSSSDFLNQLDNIESEIESAVKAERTTEDVVKSIINAKFNTLNADVNANEKDLQELMLHLRAMLDSCGGEFAKLQELNDQEQNLINSAEAKVSKEKSELQNAESMSDAWNVLLGFKNRKIKKNQKELADAEIELKSAEVEANRRYRDRLRNADIKDSLNRIISQVQGMIRIIEEMITTTDIQIDALKNRKELAFETKEKAAKVMEERLVELDDLEAKLKAAEAELEEMENGGPEYTQHQKKIADMKELRAELKGKYNIAMGILHSKERFVDQIVVHLEAQTTTKNNLKQLIGQLKSDTEERITTYESGLQLIQSATAQEAASIYEDAGTKTDQMITEIAAKVFVSSEQDRIERLKKHPGRMAELHKVLVAMAQATQKYKEKDLILMKEHGEKYGIDISQQFSWKYENEEASIAEKEAPAEKTEGEKSVNELLD